MLVKITVCSVWSEYVANFTHILEMTETLLRKKARHVMWCLDSEIDKLKMKMQTLETRRENWAKFETDLDLSKLTSVRKNDFYACFYEDVKEIASHAHLFDRPDAPKYTVDSFTVGKEIHLTLYGAHKWNHEFHTVNLKGNYVVTRIEKRDEHGHYVHLRAENTKYQDPKRVKVDEDLVHYTYESVRDIELYFNQQGDLSMANRVCYSESGERNGTGDIVSTGDPCGVLYIWCASLDEKEENM